VDSFLQGGISFADDRKENLPCNEKIKLQKLHSDKNIIKYYTSTFFNDAICIMILRRNVTVRAWFVEYDTFNHHPSSTPVESPRIAKDEIIGGMYPHHKR